MRAQLVTTPAPFKTAAFIAKRNAWYRRLEGEGHQIDELGYKQSRERAKKGPKMGNPLRYGQRDEGDRAEQDADRVNAQHFGRARPVWDLELAEYWRLISGQVEALPDNYKGKRFLRRWAECGEVKTAARDTGVSWWMGRKVHGKFVNLLKRKKVLR